MTNEATQQQPLPQGKGPAIAPLVCADIMARNEMGVKKYGEALRANNGRDALVDLYQELLDGAQYIRQEIEERKTSTAASFLVHTDDLAVDRFALVMKAKLAKKRSEGRYGWEDPALCRIEDLARMLINHIPKGDPVDVANFAMMLHQRGAGRATLTEVSKAMRQEARA
jgi:hypothetical protein